ncbi:MAG: DUF1049 domain-containing protein [Candidatus Portiera sp.]|nr:DUF1049 domain-containing protein [Portiera sp.]
MQIIHKIIFVFKGILALGLIALGIYFALSNNQQVSIDLILFSIESINIGLLIIIAVSCGTLLGILLSSIGNIFNKKN